MGVEEGTSNGDLDGTEFSEALQCLKSDDVCNGINKMDVDKGKSNVGGKDFAVALLCLKCDGVNNGVRNMDAKEGTSNGGGTELSGALPCLKGDEVSNGITEMDAEEGTSNDGFTEFSGVLPCLKSSKVNNGITEMHVEEGKSNGGGTEFSEVLPCLKSYEVNNGITEMHVEEGKKSGGGVELFEALQGLESDEVSNGIGFVVDANIPGSSSCFKSDEVSNGIRFGVGSDVAGSRSGMKSDKVNNEIRFGMVADAEGSSSGTKSDEVNNGVIFGLSADGAGRSSGRGEGFQTYKRRKRVKSTAESILEDDGCAHAKVASQLVHQPLKDPQGVFLDNNSCEQICPPTDSLDGCSQRPWKIVLEHLCQSLSDDEGGIQRSIRDALESFPGISSAKIAKEYSHHDEGRQRCPPPTRCLNGFQKESGGCPGVVSNGNLDSSSHDTITDMCRHVCFKILISEKFTSLCKLLFDNFQGIKIDNFFDLNLINSRMKDGIYDDSPVLFLTDIQQVWEKLQEVGTEMISLAKNLSDISRSCYNKQFCTWESDSYTKLEKGEDCSAYNACKGEDCSAYNACTCRQCGLEADGRDCLVCDSCEEMYHVSCIEPAVEEIPRKSWYCATCIANGIQSPHENCVVCERLNASKTVVKVGNDSSCTNEETHEDTQNELGENSDSGTDEERFQPSKRSKHLGSCKICGSEIHDDEKSKVCSNMVCPGGFYHERCLSKKQLKSYGPGWYCPSCLCRTCLTDKDDDKIVLCDSCDHAYHIYCTEPKEPCIPKGNWFCVPCRAKLAAIQKAKKEFVKCEKKHRKKASKGLGSFANHGNKWSGKGIPESDKGGGGMDMLITAADTLNYEEKLAGILHKSCKKLSG